MASQVKLGTLKHGQRFGRFGCGHAAHGSGDTPEQYGIGEGEHRAEPKTIGAGRRDQQHADKARHQRADARQANFFVQPKGGEKYRKQRRREIDRNRAGKRHQAERNDDQTLRRCLRRTAAKMVAQPIRAQHSKARARQDEYSAREELGDGAEKQNFDKRVFGNLPF